MAYKKFQQGIFPSYIVKFYAKTIVAQISYLAGCNGTVSKCAGTIDKH